mgnify:CR=1 FL=1
MDYNPSRITNTLLCLVSDQLSVRFDDLLSVLLTCRMRGSRGVPDNPLLRYSYEDHFIMKMGYTFYYTNKKSQMAPIGKFVYQPDIYTFRAGIETAGNLLYAGSSLSKQKRDPDSQAYKQFGKNTLVALVVMAVAALVLWGFDSLAKAAVEALITLV